MEVNESSESEADSDIIVLSDEENTSPQLNGTKSFGVANQNLNNETKKKRFPLERVHLGMRVLALRDKFKHIWSTATIIRIIEGI